MYRTIVVGTDGSSTAQVAVAQAVDLARVTGATLHVVCARQPAFAMAGAPELGTGFDAAPTADAAAAVLDEALAEAESVGVQAAVHDPGGPPASALVEIARAVGADLLVVGSRGMRGPRRLLGSTPNFVTHHAPCHVLVAHTS
jgi:nucleotide-binding universal stress UspA family protein